MGALGFDLRTAALAPQPTEPTVPRDDPSRDLAVRFVSAETGEQLVVYAWGIGPSWCVVRGRVSRGEHIDGWCPERLPARSSEPPKKRRRANRSRSALAR